MENSEFKLVKLRLKFDLVPYPTRVEGLVKRIIGYGEQVFLFDLHSDCLSSQSLGLVSSNTEG